ncbi:MAG: hypothetical protein LBP38_04130, partial [Desulfovibrio sp.]|nr:hypothetical protein [Desulfovibrio sp.]
AGSNTGLITPFQKHGIFCGILPGLIRNIRTISGNNRVISSLLILESFYLWIGTNIVTSQNYKFFRAVPRC